MSVYEVFHLRTRDPQTWKRQSTDGLGPSDGLVGPERREAAHRTEGFIPSSQESTSHIAKAQRTAIYK